MLFAVTGLHGCPVEAGDGHIGAIEFFLFNDPSWKVRWMVVDTGHWLPGRQVLIHPSAIAPLDLTLPAKRVLPMMSMGDTLVVSVQLTKQQIEASPEAREDQPVTKQMETDLYESLIFPRPQRVRADAESHRADGDPHLQSVASVNGYHVHATDGDLGHVENFLADDADWDIRYLVIATRNWWPGKPVQLALVYGDGNRLVRTSINVNVTRDQVKSSPAPDPLAHGGPGRRAAATPPFRFARLRLVVQARKKDGRFKR